MSLKFKKLRESKGITKKELAENLNVDYRTITNWEKANGTLPSLRVLKDIAAYFHESTYSIYNCFMNNPDDSEIPE
ncbi:MAG: helix-turn-helix transcriptional regulator, partial [Clostridia bacterium]|nr:helix-turn-helix transcriptional regulator [Clostridia bacterium]